MSRRASSKMGAFTQTQYSALANVATRCRHKLLQTRLNSIVMKREEALPLFIKPEDRDVLITAKSMITDDGLQYLAVDAKGTYTSALLSSPVTVPMRLVARTNNLSFMVPDYANGRRQSKYVEPTGPLPAHLQKYVDGRLSLAVEFGLLHSMLKWFVSAELKIPQMAYLFPPIIQMFSQDALTKKLAEKHKPGAPTFVPSPPGAKEMFALVENTLMRSFMVEDKAHRDPEILLDVRFGNSSLNFRGWEITLS